MSTIAERRAAQARKDVADNPNLQTRRFWALPRDLSDLTTSDGHIINGYTSAQTVQAHALFMFPDQVRSYQNWAVKHPTADPRAWGPLADMAMNPDSQVADAVGKASIAEQVEKGTYGQVMGQPASVQSGGAPAPSIAQPVPVEDSAWAGGLFSDARHVAGNVFGATAGRVFGEIPNEVRDVARNTITAAAAGYEAGVGFFRVGLGDAKETDKLLEPYGLSEDEKRIVFDTSERKDQGVASKDSMDFSGIGSGGMFPDKKPGFDSLTPERQKVVVQAMRAYDPAAAEKFKDFFPDVWKQTTVAAVVANPALLNKTINPKTGQVEREESWLPNKVAVQAAEREAVKAYNITTLTEAGRGISPTAWTLGRGIAHKWFDQDETAFNAMSGTVDFGASLFLDPMNAVPVGAAAKVGRGVVRGAELATAGRYTSQITRDARGFVVGGDKLAVAAPIKVVKAVRVARPGAASEWVGSKKTPAWRVAVKEGAQTVTDPSLAAREVIDPDTGLVSIKGGHSRYLMNANAWEWMKVGRGARVVDALAKETSAHKIWLQSNRKLDWDVAQQLSYATDPAAVRGIIGTRIGSELRSVDDLGAIGRAPTMFKMRLGGKYGEAGSLLDSGGLTPIRGVKGLVVDKTLSQFTSEGWKSNKEKYGLTGAVAGIGRQAFRKSPNTGAGVDLEDMDHVATQFDRWMRGTRLFNAEETSKAIDRLGNASTGAERYQIIYGKGGILDDAAKKLTTEHGLDRRFAAELTRAFEGGIDAEARMFMDQDLITGAVGSVSRSSDVGKPLLETEQLSRVAMLPEYRALRRATNSIAAIEKQVRSGPVMNDTRLKKLEDWSADFMFAATSRWRESVLIRPAYVLREIGEMVLSMSLSGYQGAFTHPGQFIANATVASQIIQQQRRMAQILTLQRKGKSISPRLAQEFLEHSEGLSRLMPGVDLFQARLTGEGFYDILKKLADPDTTPTEAAALRNELTDSLGGVVGNKQLDAATASAGARAVAIAMRDDLAHRTNYVGAWGDKIRKASTDRDMRNMANPELDATARLDAFVNSSKPLKAEMRPDLLDNTPSPRDQEYLDNYADILQQITLGQPDLMEAVLTGKFGGEDLFTSKGGRNVISPAFERRLLDVMDDEALLGQLPHSFHYLDSRAFLGRKTWAKMTDSFFGTTAELSDVFARGPLFRQAYAKRVTELVPEMTQQAKSHAVAKLRKAGDHSLAKQIQVIPVSKHGTLGVDEVDGIAMGFAGRESKRIFYDAHERQNYALAMRTIAPFAQATFNTFRRWGQMSLQNPQMLYRTSKPIVALNDPGSAAIYDIFSAAYGGDASQQYFTPGHPEANVDGFFFTNQYGDRQFVYPAVGALAGLLTGGENIQAVGSAGSLNVAGQTTNPGAGPGITFAASLFAATTIHEDTPPGEILRIMFPYPLPKGNLATRLYESITPTWGRRLNAATDEEQIAGMTARIMGSMAASGDYDLTNVADRGRMVNDAHQLSFRLSVADAMMSLISPLPTTVRSATSQGVGPDDGDNLYTSADEAVANRKFMLQDRLIQEFRKYTADDYNQGLMTFVNDYGRNALFAVLPASTSATGDSLPAATNDIWEFRSSEPEAYRNFTSVLGLFFAGGDVEENFSKELYAWQKETGERRNKTGQEDVDAVNNAMGWMLWEQQSKPFDVDMTGWSTEQRAAAAAQKAETKDAIKEQFPGWTGTQTDPGKFPAQIDALQDAVEDPAIQTLPSTKFIADYLATRDDAIAALRQATGSSDLSTGSADSDQASSRQAAAIRDSLLQVAARFNREDKSGGFHNAWTRLLSYEFGEDF